MLEDNCFILTSHLENWYPRPCLLALMANRFNQQCTTLPDGERLAVCTPAGSNFLIRGHAIEKLLVWPRFQLAKTSSPGLLPVAIGKFQLQCGSKKCQQLLPALLVYILYNALAVPLIHTRNTLYSVYPPIYCAGLLVCPCSPNFIIKNVQNSHFCREPHLTDL